MLKDQMLTMKIHLILDEWRGIYIPQEFASGRYVDLEKWGLNLESWALAECLKGPEGESYWLAWDEILRTAVYTDEAGVKYQLHHDGDLWAVALDDPDTQKFLNENWGFDFEIAKGEA